MVLLGTHSNNPWQPEPKLRLSLAGAPRSGTGFIGFIASTSCPSGTSMADSQSVSMANVSSPLLEETSGKETFLLCYYSSLQGGGL
jgi:hypothetical protein